MGLFEEIEIPLDQGTLPDPCLYQYFLGLKNNTLIINEEVSDAYIELFLVPLEIMDKDEKIKHINILLNTVGGDLYTGFAIVAALERLQTPTTLRIVGMAASMGALIAMAKNPNLHVVCDAFSVGLIHSGQTYVEGNTHAVKDICNFNEKYENKIKDYILSHTKITQKKYKEIERQEFWMDAEDMVKYGIVDEII